MDLNIAILSESSTPETTPATPSTAVHTPNILNDRSTISTAATTPTFQNSVSGNGNSVSKSSKSLANVPRILPISSNNCRKDCEATPASDSFVPSLATVLTHLVSLSPAERGQVTRFHAVKAPDISIRDYLERIQRYFGCSNECFVLSLIYIDRVVKIHEEFTVSILNIHRLLITSVMLAAKFFDDIYFSNAFYARVGGVRTKEINQLEMQFLLLVKYQLYVTPREYDQYLKNVFAAVNAGIQRPLPPAASTLPTSVSSATHNQRSNNGHDILRLQDTNEQNCVRFHQRINPRPTACYQSPLSHIHNHGIPLSHYHVQEMKKHDQEISSSHDHDQSIPLYDSNCDNQQQQQALTERPKCTHPYSSTGFPRSSPDSSTEQSLYACTLQHSIDRCPEEAMTPTTASQQFSQRSAPPATSDLVVSIRGSNQGWKESVPPMHGQPVAQPTISAAIQSSSVVSPPARQSCELTATVSMVSTNNSCSESKDTQHNIQIQRRQPTYNDPCNPNELQNSISLRTVTSRKKEDHPHRQNHLYHQGKGNHQLYDDHHFVHHYSTHEASNGSLLHPSSVLRHPPRGHFHHPHESVVMINNH